MLYANTALPDTSFPTFQVVIGGLIGLGHHTYAFAPFCPLYNLVATLATPACAALALVTAFPLIPSLYLPVCAPNAFSRFIYPTLYYPPPGWLGGRLMKRASQPQPSTATPTPSTTVALPYAPFLLTLLAGYRCMIR